MADELDHDAADELLRKVDRRDAGHEARTPAHSALNLPPMDLGFRHEESARPSRPAPRAAEDQYPTTVFGPEAGDDETPTRQLPPVTDRDPPEGGEEIDPVDKPRTGMGDFDVVVDRHGPLHFLTARPVVTASVVAVVALVTAAVLTVTVFADQDDPSPEALPAPANAPAALTRSGEPEPALSASPTPTTEPSTPAQAAWKDNPEKVFSWYGDGLSEIAATFKPIIGTSDFMYFWNTDNDTTTDQVLVRIEQAVDSGDAGDLIVFAQGNNNDVTAVQMNRLRQVVGDRALVLVGTGVSDPQALPWSSQLNGRYQKLAAERPDTYYVDWQSTVTADPGLVERGFILTEEGTREWVAQINSAILAAYR